MLILVFSSVLGWIKVDIAKELTTLAFDGSFPKLSTIILNILIFIYKFIIIIIIIFINLFHINIYNYYKFKYL
jgi:hypothetical protein